VTAEARVLSDETIVWELDRAWGNEPLGQGTRFFVFLDQMDERKFELDGALIQRIVSSFEYDDFGNETLESVVSNTAGGSDAHLFETSTAYVPADQARWLISLRDLEQVYRQTPDGTSATRAVQFAHDPLTGFEIRRVLEPNDSDLTLEIGLVRDNRLGLIVEEQVQGASLDVRSTFLQYDASGRFVERLVGPVGHVVEVAYDGRTGKPLLVTDPNGLPTKLGYDPIGREEYRVEPDGTVTTTAYEDCRVGCGVSSPLAIRVVRGGSPPQVLYLDELRRPIGVDSLAFDGRETRSLLTYDSLGRLIATTLPHFVDGSDTPMTSTRAYDDLDRVRVFTEPDGIETIVDFAVAGWQERTTTRLSRTRIESIDSAGRLRRLRDAMSGVTQYAYEPFGNVKLTIDDHQTVYATDYDVRGRLVGFSHPDRGQWTFEYDGVGNRIRQTDARGITSTLSYDPMDRLVSRHDGSDETIWIYDEAPHGVGLVSTVRHGTEYEEVRRYDVLGRPYWREVSIDGERLAVHRSYDAHSRPERTSYPSGVSVVGSYNALGYLEKVEDGDTGLDIWKMEALDALGRQRRYRLGDDSIDTIEVNRTFHELNGLISEIAIERNGASIGVYGFFWDDNRNLEARTGSDDPFGARWESFSHDGLNRVTFARVGSEVATTYTYDLVGNMLARSDVGGFELDPTAPHRVTAVSGLPEAFQYDANGNLWTDGFRFIDYTAFNKVASLTEGDFSATYDYGPDQTLVKRQMSTPTEITRTTYLDDSFERLEVNDELAEERSLIRVGGELVATVVEVPGEGSERVFRVPDHLGSTTVLLPEGEEAEYMSYDAFGQPRSPDWTPGIPQLFASADRLFGGKRYEAPFRLYDFEARFLSPRMSRFLSPDPVLAPIGEPQLLNPYSYAMNNPLALRDPSGMLPALDETTAFAAATMYAIHEPMRGESPST
jgi:RHS repeat-associated protein